jgi:hypothetical protein
MALSWIPTCQTDQYVEKLSDNRLEKSDEEQDFFIYQYNRIDHWYYGMHDDFSFYYE